MALSIPTVILLLVPVLTLGPTPGEPAEPRRVAAGLWGGRHVALEVGDDGASVEFDCALGTVDEPLVVDDSGVFEARGTFSPQRGGPEREGETLPRHPALYRGSVEDDSMRLEVSLTESGEDLGTFDLTRGAEPRLFKCL